MYELDFSDTDILIVEAPKGKSDFVFQAVGEEKEESDEEVTDNSLVVGKSLSDLDLDKILKTGSRRGLVGLQNLGNTCFMNSGLQCLSNTMELTKYFLFNMYQEDINEDNPLGLGGNLAKAYHSLLVDIWIGKDARTAPYDLKRVLGKKIARFSGYGQQDACELLNYLLDLIHEDLNRVKKKPYVEMPDQNGRSDQEMSNLYWKAFQERNKSIIVDLMYG